MESASEGQDDEKDQGLAAKLQKELAEEKMKGEGLMTRFKYMQADYENYRKRTDKEVEAARTSLSRALLSRLLVVQDELDLALQHAGSGGSGKQLNEGLEMVSKNLTTALESVGVERIQSVGKPFDPSLHEAVEKVQGKGAQDIVIEEVRPGFTFRGELLRPSMVKVELASRRPAEAKASE
jgi:molecular chaperone GrpE